MEDIILEASVRAKGKFRESGYIAGVLYGDGIEATTEVKFDEKAVNKVLSNHGANAKVWVMLNNNKKYGFIREVQRKNITRTVAHIDVQIVSTDHEVKLQIPINYKGEDLLKSRQLQLQINKSDITVFGKMALIPNSIDVDVAEMKVGDTIRWIDLNLDKLLKSENEDLSLATIIHLKAQPVEEVVTK